MRSRTPMLAAMFLAFVPRLAIADEHEPSRAPLVHLEVPRSPGLPGLERRDPSSSIWQRVCDEPCDVRLAVDADYRVAGRGVVDSSAFRLPADSSRVAVRANVGSSLLQGIGTAFLVSGLLFVAGGAALFAVPDKPQPDSPRVVGVGFVAMGALSLGVGLALHFGSSTDVTIEPLAQSAAR